MKALRQTLLYLLLIPAIPVLFFLGVLVMAVGIPVLLSAMFANEFLGIEIPDWLTKILD